MILSRSHAPMRWRRTGGAGRCGAMAAALLAGVGLTTLPLPAGATEATPASQARMPDERTAAPAADPQGEETYEELPPLPERPEEIVRTIYRALDGKDPSLSPVDWTEPETARQLFVPSLAGLAVAEGRRAVPDRRLPFDPFTGALQIRPERVAVRTVSSSQTKAEVVARFTVSRITRTVSYRVTKGADGWRIADIWWGTDRSRTFRRLLQ